MVGGQSIRLFPAVKKVVSRTNCLMFFGKELSKRKSPVNGDNMLWDNNR